MKYKIVTAFFLVVLGLYSCKSVNKNQAASPRIRPLVDTVGFAHLPWQMDALMTRFRETGWKENHAANPWKTVICPHDDYTYTGAIYPELLENVKAATVLLIGVAHKAAQLKIEDSLVFETYGAWKGPWKNVRISAAREEIYRLLKGKYAMLSDTLQRVEHSLEALIPFLQYFNRNVEIVPVIVPAMSPERMKECGKALAEALRNVVADHNWTWGKDFAIVATTDAVHYGNEDWGGSDRARFGCDSEGNEKALMLEHEIIDNCLKGDITPEKIRLFSSYTLDKDDYHVYKWTWCGRYSVPVALYTSYFLATQGHLSGELVDYSTSITRFHVPVDDLRMGRTAIATPCHWVGYAALGYR
ncbi:MAG TPA: AmmeMemoRadiSam system protein B [Bacteroidales bacterium]|nr:AmmeMemoRadiSam system protein B [Bacteroidales bacterium]